MKQRISREERFEIFATHSSNKDLYISGVLSSLTLCFIIVLVVLLMSIITATVKIYSINAFLGKLLPYMIVMFFMGAVSARLKKFEFLQGSKVPYVYILLSATLLFVSMIELTVLISTKNASTFAVLEYLSFTEINQSFWFIVFVVILFLSFSLGNPVEILWTDFYKFYLNLFSSTDYRSVYNKEHFYLQISELFYNAQRYQNSFSIIVFRLNNYISLKSKFKKKRLLEIHDELLEMLNENIRKTDASGYIKEGETYCILLQANKVQADMIAQRIIVKVENYFSAKYKEPLISLSAKVWGYSTSWKNADDLINDIVKDAEIEGKPEFLRM